MPEEISDKEYEKAITKAIADEFGFGIKQGKGQIWYVCKFCDKRYSSRYYGESENVRMIRHAKLHGIGYPD